MKPLKYKVMKVVKRKAAKRLLKSSQITIDFLYRIMVHNEGNVGKQF